MMASNLQDTNDDSSREKQEDDRALKKETLDQDVDPSSPFLMPEITHVTTLKEEGYNNEETERMVVAPEVSWSTMNKDPINIDSNDDENTDQFDNRDKERSISYMDYDSGENNDDDYGYRSSRKRKRFKKSAGKRKTKKSVPTSSERLEAGAGSIEIFNNPEDVFIPDGWTRRVFQRLGGKSAGKFDVIYINPHGKRFRSKIAIVRYYAENNISNPDLDIESLMFGYGCGNKGTAPELPEHLRLPQTSSEVEKGPTKSNKLALNKTKKTSENQSKLLDKTKEMSDNQSKSPDQEKVPDGVIEEELFSLKWNSHKATFFENLKLLREKSNYTDATLAVEGKFYPVHKLVMSTCSDYFSEIFEKTPCKSPVIVLQNVRSYDMEALLDFMYLGEVNVNQKNIPSLLITAACLKIKGFALPDEDKSKSCQVSTSSHDDAGQASQSPLKRKPHNSNTIAPHNMSPVTSSQISTTTVIKPDQSPSRPPPSRSPPSRPSPSIPPPSTPPPSSHSPVQDEPSNFVQVEMDDDAGEEEEMFMEENNIESDVSHESDAGGSCMPEASVEESDVKFPFEIGHRASVLKSETAEGFTHDWEVFVQGDGGAALEPCVEKVVFLLHKSFTNHKREIKAPPYRVAEKGYGSFVLPIEIFFKTSDNKIRKRRIEYDLELQPLNEPPLENVKKENFTFVKPSDDFRRKLLAGGGELQWSEENESERNDGAKVSSNSQQDTKKHKKDKRKGGVGWDDSYSGDHGPTSQETEGETWPLWEPVDQNNKPVDQKSDPVDKKSASTVDPVDKNSLSIVDNYPCTVCSEIYLFPSELRRHMRSHTDEKPYQCLYCGVKMAQNALLQEHIFKSHPTLRIEKKKTGLKKRKLNRKRL